MGLRTTAYLGRATLVAALSAMTLSAHAGVTTLLAVPWGLIYVAATKLSERNMPSAPPTKSTPADASPNHWVFRSSGTPKLPPILALAQLQKDFGDAIRTKVPTAAITTGVLAIPAAEHIAPSALTSLGWLACDEPVFEARAESEKSKRLHVCMTHSQAGFQTAIYAFDAERHGHFANLPFTQKAPTGEFLSDPEGQAGALAEQVKAALQKVLGATELTYVGTVRQQQSAPTAPRAGHAH